MSDIVFAIFDVVKTMPFAQFPTTPLREAKNGWEIIKHALQFSPKAY